MLNKQNAQRANRRSVYDDCRTQAPAVSKPLTCTTLQLRKPKRAHALSLSLPRYLYTSVCMYVNIYIYIYIHTYTHSSMCTHMCIYIYMYIYIYVYMYYPLSLHLCLCLHKAAVASNRLMPKAERPETQTQPIAGHTPTKTLRLTVQTYCILDYHNLSIL